MINMLTAAGYAKNVLTTLHNWFINFTNITSEISYLLLH